MATYEEDGCSVFEVGEECLNCGSDSTEFYPYYGYWKCENCSSVWGRDFDDPDYDDVPMGDIDMSLNQREPDVNEKPLPIGGGSSSRVEDRIVEYFTSLPRERRRAILDQLASQNDLLNQPKAETV